MSPFAGLLLVISCLTLVCSASAQGRAPHGLVYESPMAFSPSAYDFFHPKAHNPDSQTDCTASRCSPLPMVAHVEASQADQSKLTTSPKGEHNIGAGAITGIVIGLAFVAFLAMGAYYIARKHRANMSRGNDKPVQSDA